ncbi:hypothetical protein CVT26_001021 [Gymnopilus dilepis]|uniref:Uncharacterized protein n=1 Tax=Gymnopilus dilepis TaxID=231916 RepID=A0A409Y296_9AGAR|nr:hypothetical protein CVT26_001021 [Gymnopilus dilepis]
MLRGNPIRSSMAYPQLQDPSQETMTDADPDQEAVGGLTLEGDVRLPKRASNLVQLAHVLDIPDPEELIRRFLYDQLHPNSEICGMDMQIQGRPIVSPTMQIHLFRSAAAVYHAPSDLSGVGGMHREHIRATRSWHGGLHRYDCVFVERELEEEGFRALGMAQVRVLFSFEYNNVPYSCPFVKWFETYGDTPCSDTGFWRVKPDFTAHGQRMCSILRAAHHIGVFGTT